MFNLSRRTKQIAQGGGLVISIIGGITAYDAGTRRSLIFWSQAFPMYLHYRAIQILNRDLGLMSDERADAIYEELHEKYTDETKRLTYELRGFYLKHAQLMSIQDSFVPPAYMKWVKNTQDNVPSEFKGDEARIYVANKMKEELGLDFYDVFTSWDDSPLGVASVGEVHKATLKTGEVVAVKILCPGIEEKFKSDISTIKSFCQLAMPQHLSGLNEVERQFLTEFNYVLEGENMNKLRNNILPRFGKEIAIPKAYMEFCSKHILVMEFLDGVKLVDGIRNQYEAFAKKLGISPEEFERKRKQAYLEENSIPDPRSASVVAVGTNMKSFKQMQDERVLLKRQVFLNDLFNTNNGLKVIYNWSIFGLITGPYEYDWTEVPVDLGHIISLLCRIQASQLFDDGFFNGDAHPGNIMLLKDGRLGLIDFGQMKTMSMDERINYAKLIVAHARRDKEEVVRLVFDVMGTKTKYQDPHYAYLLSAFYNDRNTSDICGDMNIASFIDYIQAK
eukprot:gene16275-22172_t